MGASTILSRPTEHEWIDARTIYLVRAGSRAYGTDTPESDEDLRGVCIPPARYLIGLSQFEQAENRAEDTVVFSLHKFVRLALACNPNIIETLFVRAEDIVACTPEGQRLREFGPRFLSTRAFKTFGGYATAQLRKLTNKGRSHHGRHRDLIEAHGFDAKHGMHLLRLLRMGMEVLRTGEVHTYRPDREELLAVRLGRRSVESVLAEAARLELDLQDAAQQTCLPESPDSRGAEKLVMELSLASLEG